MSPDNEYLPFQVAPHMLEDFGLNLYSDLPRALIEFVANAHDADAGWADIMIDFTAIKQQRDIERAKHNANLERFNNGELDEAPQHLGTLTLPEDIKISILDNGDGMSEGDIENKYLVAGRKRREHENKDSNSQATTESGRLLMGRKGLGKLAAFGIAKRVEIISRRKGESHATKILLDFDDIRTHKSLADVRVPKTTLSDGGGIEYHGTKVILSKLLHEPSKSKESTVKKHVGEHFELIQPEEFEVRMNGERIPPPERAYVYSYPQNEEVPPDQLVSEAIATPDGPVSFNYRIRFRGKDAALPASQRGVRIYAHRRLAAVPSLLNTNPNTHGFRQADYLEGVVEADFIDDQPGDYIATDRQSLRWETPMLVPLHEFLSKAMADACNSYQKTRDEKVPNIVKSDAWTQDIVRGQGLSKRDENLAYRIATSLSRSLDKDVKDPDYQERLGPIIQGLGQGAILQAITKLANEPHPDLQRAAVEITRLTKDQLDRSIGFIRARVKGINALTKIVKDQNFKDNENEKEIQELFEKSPWLVDSTYSHILTGDIKFVGVLDRLAKELQIAEYAPPDSEANDKRPDLVFLLGNASAGKVVIVELKSANTYLKFEHLGQLEYYMEIAEQWLAEHGHAHIRVQGKLIGSLAPTTSRAQQVVTLRRRINETGPTASWEVFDYLNVLENTLASHQEMLAVYEASENDQE